ncbi:F-box/FBD/LRR-repeat protein At1g13570-like [Nicotiana tabacum]|uniref:F-box/FBD/LRR-repeat protein At1g13570-like n=1 Tax=Nicotiana tabacum TaxID=4097 RepID=A0AC58TG02_TOBAC
MEMQFNKRLSIGVEVEDRLSEMPGNIIDHILDLMPIKDAAKTSILARKWRYIWCMHPNIVLDKLTCRKFSTNPLLVLDNTINQILLQHIGNIIKFVLDFSQVDLLPLTNIDMWIRYVIIKGVRDLTLDFSNNNPYKLPTYIYYYQNMTDLTLNNCLFKPQDFIFSYPNLKTLYLKQITFMATPKSIVLKAPLLANLTIMYCWGTESLNIVSPKLSYLFVVESHYLDLSSFMKCSNLAVVSLSLCKVVENPRQYERSTLLKFIFGLPMLEKLYLDTFYLKFLGEDPFPRSLPVVQNCLRHMMLSLALSNLAQVSFALHFIPCFHNSKTLQIWVFDTGNHADDVLNYLEKLKNLDRPIPNLEQVVIRSFTGSKPELLFIKLLFAATPSLIRMSIERDRIFTSTEDRKITGELMRYPRASSKAELFYLPPRRL